MTTSTTPGKSHRRGRLMGMSLETSGWVSDWANVALIASLIAGVIATYFLVATGNIKEAELKRQVALANVGAAKANELAVKSQERIAELNNETAKLVGDNLALQTAMQPRHVGLFGIDQEAPAKKWFAGFEQWAGTKVLIQVIPGDPEALNLANEIAIVLSRFGWQPEMIDAKRSGISLTLKEGVAVYSPSSHKAWDHTNASQQLFARFSNAAISLAKAFTQAGLGVGEYPVSGVYGAGIVVDFPPDSDAGRSQYARFNPPLDGVFVEVGSRPISSTVAWIKAGRPDQMGNKAK